MWTSAPGTYECTHNSLVGQVQGWDGQGSLGLLLVQLFPWLGRTQDFVGAVALSIWRLSGVAASGTIS